MFEIIDNKIIFDAFVVTCDSCCATPAYMQEMAEVLQNCQDGPEAFKKLWYMNNDGTWQVTPE